MRLVAEYARRVVLIRDGRVAADTTPAEIFDQPDLLATSGVHAPQVARLAEALRPQGMPAGVCTVEGFVGEYRKLAGGPA